MPKRQKIMAIARPIKEYSSKPWLSYALSNGICVHECLKIIVLGALGPFHSRYSSSPPSETSQSCFSICLSLFYCWFFKPSVFSNEYLLFILPKNIIIIINHEEFWVVPTWASLLPLMSLWSLGTCMLLPFRSILGEPFLIYSKCCLLLYLFFYEHSSFCGFPQPPLTWRVRVVAGVWTMLN